jgi:hypothetical protein
MNMMNKVVPVTGSTDGLARAHPDAYNPAIRKRLRQLSFQLSDPSVAH